MIYIIILANSMLFRFLLLLGLLLCITVHAEDEVSPNENDFLLNLSLEDLLAIKVTVASLSEETLNEAPVPVSVITAQMIEQSGALTLKELLITYVPGFTDIEDQNEVNVAARGIYTSSQQKILIMVDGHRLNSRSYSMAAPDFSISLEKIKQIEVLRGPASSLYGNVSLTATINIILKNGDDKQGTKIKLLAGNYGQQGISVTHNQRLADYNLLFWGATFQSDGEKRTLTAENVYTEYPNAVNQTVLGRFNDKYSYDVGISLKSDTAHLLINSQRGHYTEPFSGAGLTGEPYNTDNYQKINDNSAGFGYVLNHIEIGKITTFDQWRNDTRLYWDNTDVDSPFIISPKTFTLGYAQWQDKSLGLLSTIERTFNDSELLVGIQLEQYQVYGANFLLGIKNFEQHIEMNNMLPNGTESNRSAFVQFKHPVSAHWNTNIGARYDFKNRKTTDNITEISPRLALIYSEENTSITFSYSQAFVDATYWNRFSNLAAFKGAKNLKPEKLRSLQITPSITLPDYNLQLTSNFFYDQAIDVIYRDNTASDNNYSNAGMLKNWGIEQEVTYIKDDLQVRFNATYRKAINSELIKINSGNIANIPALSSNLIIDKKLSDHLAVNVSFRYTSKQYSPIMIQKDGVNVQDPFPNSGVNFNNDDYYVASAFLINTNVRYQLSKAFSVNAYVNNLLDKHHLQGGSTLHPYQKTGRWFNINAQYQF